MCASGPGIHVYETAPISLQSGLVFFKTSWYVLSMIKELISKCIVHALSHTVCAMPSRARFKFTQLQLISWSVNKQLVPRVCEGHTMEAMSTQLSNTWPMRVRWMNPHSTRISIELTEDVWDTHYFLYELRLARAMTVHRITGNMSDLCALCTYRHVTYFQTRNAQICTGVCYCVTGWDDSSFNHGSFSNYDTHFRVITDSVYHLRT
jgi:hypothetical protein